jgi:alcohol dehydrogenase, propanol-preferring
MRAMVLKQQKTQLQLMDLPIPKPNEKQVLVKVHACGLCRTDLHIIDGELKEPQLPLILGHQIVGTIVKIGEQVQGCKLDQRVGIPWLGSTCGKCEYCTSGRENLCDFAKFTGYQINGGLAEFCVADPHFCFPIPENYPDEQAAPLLCAGLIGYRALRIAGRSNRLGLYGFGAAAHILIQVARYQGREVYAFVRKGDQQAQEFALELGAKWAGTSEEKPPTLLDAAIIFAPVGELVPVALRAVAKGGRVVCGGIYMTDIPSFPYSILWGERSISSVANLTRTDGEEFLSLAPKIPIKTTVHVYPLEDVNKALDNLRAGRFSGAYVIKL